MEGAWYQQLPLFVTFIDFQKAFDSIDRMMMFAILRHYAIPEKIVRALLSGSKKDAQLQVKSHSAVAKEVGLLINIGKTEVMTPACKDGITLVGEEIK